MKKISIDFQREIFLRTGIISVTLPRQCREKTKSYNKYWTNSIKRSWRTLPKFGLNLPFITAQSNLLLSYIVPTAWLFPDDQSYPCFTFRFSMKSLTFQMLVFRFCLGFVWHKVNLLVKSTSCLSFRGHF